MIMKIRILLLTMICLFPLLAGGQALKGSYFSEMSVLRNKMNPAFVPRSSYLTIPVIGNTGFGISGNVGLSNFLYPAGDGSLQTFLHPDVSSATFFGKLPANPHLDIDVDTDIFNVGFFTGPKSFWSIGLGVKVDGEVNLPKSMFAFLKNGAETDPQTYNIRNLSVIANAYAELSVGYSHDMSDFVKGLSIGGRVKLLAGLGGVFPEIRLKLGRGDLRVNNLDLTMSSDVWNVRADATGYLMLKGMDVYKTGDRQYGSRFDSSQIGLAGMGAAMDLGAEYRLYINGFFDYIKFSAAVTDLGFLSFSSKAVQKFQTSGNVEYTGVNDIQLGQDMNLQETFNGIKDQFLEILDLQEVAAEKVTSRIRPQLFVGVELPILWDNMCVGLLYNAKFGYTSTRNELALALNARPKDWINFGVNYSMLNTWKSLGWILEFIPKSGVGFFIGSDYFMLQRAKLPIGESSLAILPVNQANFNLRFSFHIAMGKNY